MYDAIDTWKFDVAVMLTFAVAPFGVIVAVVGLKLDQVNEAFAPALVVAVKTADPPDPQKLATFDVTLMKGNPTEMVCVNAQPATFVPITVYVACVPAGIVEVTV